MNNSIKTINANTVNSTVAREIKASIGGQFVTITAIKKDGTLIKVNGKLTGSPASHISKPNLFTIKRSHDGAYKSIDISKIKRFAYNRQVLSIV